MSTMQPTVVPPAERRIAARRQPTQGTVCRLTTSAGEDLGVGLVWNISTSGVSMLLNKRLEPGAMLRGELRTSDDRIALPFGMRVAHVSPLRTGDYFLGAQFHHAITAEEMRPFLGLPVERAIGHQGS